MDGVGTPATAADQPRPHAWAVTGALYRRKNAFFLYRILFANQAGVLGPDADPTAMVDQRRFEAVLRHAGMTAFDLMHLSAKGEAAIQGGQWLSRRNSGANAAAARANGRGVLICGCHLSNFNLAFLYFHALKGFPLADPFCGG